MSVLATDTFTGTDATSPTSANWATQSGLGGVEIRSNQASNVGGSNSGQRYTAVSAPDDQYVKCTIVKTIATADQGPGPAARMAAGATTFYFGQCNTTDIRLYKVVANAFTQLGSTAGAVAVNDIIELDCVGTAITLKKNGSTIIGPITDSAIATGSAGIWIGGLSADDCAVDTWEMGDFGGITGVSVTVSLGVLAAQGGDPPPGGGFMDPAWRYARSSVLWSGTSTLGTKRSAWSDSALNPTDEAARDNVSRTQ